MNLTKTLKQRKMNKVLLTLLQALLVFNQTTFKYPTMTLTMFCKHASYIPMYRTRLWFKCVVLHKILCLSSVCAYVSQRDIFVKLFIVKRTGIWHRFLVIFLHLVQHNRQTVRQLSYWQHNYKCKARGEWNY